MPVNANQPHIWKQDTADSVDFYNKWFLRYAPTTFRTERLNMTAKVATDLVAANDLLGLSKAVLKANPAIITTLRMSCCPPIARDRLVGLAYTGSALIHTMEEGNLPKRMATAVLDPHLDRMASVINQLLDKDLCPWLNTGVAPSNAERDRASSIIADRLTGAVADPLIRNEQEKRQLAEIEAWLVARGYTKANHPTTLHLNQMPAGTFGFRMNVLAGANNTRIPVDCVVQPKTAVLPSLPILIEAKSAGDFTNVNKRRKEEAQKNHQLQHSYPGVHFVLFLCGYFDAGYLGYSASEGLDWVWEHRVADLALLGL